MTTEQFIQEQQDRREIRGLVDSYAYCADRRNCEGQMNLFTKTPTLWYSWTAMQLNPAMH